VKAKKLVLIIILVAGIAIAFLTMNPSRTPERITVGNIPHDFELMDINKNKIKLSDMKGSVVFLNFWATWCTSCIEEMPSIERLSGIFSGNSQFKVVTVLYKDDLGRALSFMNQNAFTFPVYLNQDDSAARQFGLTGVPETFIIDKKGILRDKVLGPAEWDSPGVVASLQNLINEL
jgi:cytochrome c biogenesis protein CcmG, thiol:disulfide interchange protein DsbE